MKRAVLAILVCLAIAATAWAGQTNQEPQKSPETPAAKPAHSGGTADRGQRVFMQNCARCHDAPQGFSANISGTVARHMRVRANLSEADYKALLKFLHP